MIDQGTYRSSACPYECTRRITRHEVVESNEASMLSGLGLLGEHFFYPGQEDSDQGFSRFLSSGIGVEGKLHPLHMERGVTLDQCDDIVRRHQLLAPHGVWLVDRDHEDASVTTASAERLGDCGLFLGARSSTDADLWRAFYRYARLVLRLGHTDTWLDEDIRGAAVHSSSERVCNGATTKVCLWWSEFDLDDEEFSCRPKRDASNIVTPSILLATLAENDVAYPPPSPPPPLPPASPPPPLPPPGAIRCELTSIASTNNYKVPAFDPVTRRYVPVQQKCWRWDPGNEWPPYVAHRDVYMPRDRCSGGRSRDIQWTGGFKQSLLAKGDWDPLHQNNDDCPYKASFVAKGEVGTVEALRMRGREEDGAQCSDGADETKTDAENSNLEAMCSIGTNMRSCGIRKNLVVFGYAQLEMYHSGTTANGGTVGQGPIYREYYYDNVNGVGQLNYGRCILKTNNKWGWAGDWFQCRDGGPGAAHDDCYYGTNAVCGKRRFAFALEDAGPGRAGQLVPSRDHQGLCRRERRDVRAQQWHLRGRPDVEHLPAGQEPVRAQHRPERLRLPPGQAARARGPRWPSPTRARWSRTRSTVTGRARISRTTTTRCAPTSATTCCTRRTCGCATTPRPRTSSAAAARRRVCAGRWPRTTLTVRTTRAPVRNALLSANGPARRPPVHRHGARGRPRGHACPKQLPVPRKGHVHQPQPRGAGRVRVARQHAAQQPPAIWCGRRSTTNR